MNMRRVTVLFGILALVICMSTWILDVTHIVSHCIYCRNERSVIGLLGLLMLLSISPSIVCYLSWVVGFFGASIASQHILLIMKSGDLFPLEMILVIGALFFIIGQVYFITTVISHKHP